LNVKSLIEKLSLLPSDTIVVLENPNTGACSKIKGFEKGRWSEKTKEFSATDDAEDSNSVVLL